MARCANCGRDYKMNWTRTPICTECRRRHLEVEQVAADEERLEASMGSVPDYVRPSRP